MLAPLAVLEGDEVLADDPQPAPVARPRPGGDRDGPAGRPLRSGARMAEALASLAGERPLVTLTCDGHGGVVRGELLAAGTDVVVIGAAEGSSPARSAVYVRLSAVAELSLMASG